MLGGGGPGGGTSGAGPLGYGIGPPGTVQASQEPQVVQACHPDPDQITEAIQVFISGSKTCAHCSRVNGELGFMSGFQQASRIWKMPHE